MCGDKPEWDRNLEAARNAGAEIERAVQKLEAQLEDSDSLTACQEEQIKTANSQAV